MNRFHFITLCLAFTLFGVAANAQDHGGIIGPHPIQRQDPARAEAIQKLRLEARDLLKQGEDQKGIALLEQVLNYGNDNLLLAVVYTRLGKSDDVIRVLKPIIYPNFPNPTTPEPSIRMLYVVALLNKRRWDEAVTVYEPTINANPTWNLLGVGSQLKHTFPNVHFDTVVAEYAAMRAQAYLILGASPPADSDDCENWSEYMLDNLKQSLKYNSQSPDAHFLSGLLLVKLNRFDEAQKAFQKAAKFAPDAAQPEIEAALKDVREKIIQMKVLDTRKADQVQHPDTP